MRSGSVSTLGINLTTFMARDIGTVELITFGSRDIGTDGVTATASGFTDTTECADLASFINSVVSLETSLPDVGGEGC
jgi:hypothetical protein